MVPSKGSARRGTKKHFFRLSQNMAVRHKCGTKQQNFTYFYILKHKNMNTIKSSLHEYKIVPYGDKFMICYRRLDKKKLTDC